MGFFNASPHKNWVIANTANRPQVTNGVNCEEQDRTFQGGPAGDTQLVQVLSFPLRDD